jgi:hypothetical protein
MPSPQPPRVLNYNQPAPKRVLQVRHPPLATILLLLNTLLGAAMLLAFFFPIDSNARRGSSFRLARC